MRRNRENGTSLVCCCLARRCLARRCRARRGARTPRCAQAAGAGTGGCVNEPCIGPSPWLASGARAVGLLGALLATLSSGCGPTLHTGRTIVPLDPQVPAAGSVPLYWEHYQPSADAEGPPLLVFHGGPGVPEPDLRALPFWDGLVTHVPVIYFDQRGAGRSGRLDGLAAPPERAALYRLARLADDAGSVRQNALGARGRVVAFGVSAGAQVALLYALRHPAEVRALVLVEPAADHRWVSASRTHIESFLDGLAGEDPGAAAGVARLRAADKGPLCAGVSEDTLRIGVVGREAYTRAGQRRLSRALAALGRGDTKPLCALVPDRTRPSSLLDAPLRSEALFRTIACAELGWADVSSANCEGVEEAERLDLTPRLADVRVPVLILSSIHDPIVPAALHEGVRAGLGGPVTIVRFEESGHLLLQEQPDAAREAVLAFLRSLAAER